MHSIERPRFPVAMAIVSLLLLSLLPGCGNNTGSSAPTGTSMPPTPAVILQISAANYQPGSTIGVTINNQSQQTIAFVGHQTNCTVLRLERQVAAAWQMVAPCQLRSLTRIYTLDPGKSQEVRLTASSQWQTGSYRAHLDYNNGRSMDASTTEHAYSSEFSIG